MILGEHVTKIGCNLSILKVFVYIEIGSSLRLSSRILKNYHQCGIATIVLRERNKEIYEINDDGVQMYLLAMVKNANSVFRIPHIRKHSGDKHRSYFIILVQNSENITRGWLRKAFEEFWKIWNELFTDQLPNMNKSPFRISIYPEPVRAIFPTKNKYFYRGVDGRLSDFITESLNATKIIVIPKPKQCGSIFENGSADGGIGAILRNEADMEINTRFLLPDIFKNNVEFTSVVGRDDLCIMVPKARNGSLFFNIFRCFELNVWLMLLLAFIGASIVLKLLNRNATGDNIITLFSTICSVPIKFHLKEENFLKIFYGFWLTFCFFINGAYVSNLTSSLVSPISIKEYDNLEDLLHFPHSILTQDHYFKQLNEYMEYPFQMYPDIRQKILAVSYSFMVHKIQKNNLHYGFIEKKHLIDFWIHHKNHSQYGQPLYHKMKMCPVPLMVVYIVQYGSPYLGYINTMLGRVHEHGFSEKWNRLYESHNNMHNRIDDTDSAGNGPEVLKLKHLQATFFLLLIGLALSSLVLVGENIWKH